MFGTGMFWNGAAGVNGLIGHCLHHVLGERASFFRLTAFLSTIKAAQLSAHSPNRI